MQNILYQVLHPWHWLTYSQNASGVGAVAAAVAALAAVLGLIGLYFYTRYTRSMMLLGQETQRATITPILVSTGSIEFVPLETKEDLAAELGLIAPTVTGYRPVLTVRNVGEGAAIYITSWAQAVTEKFTMGGSILFLQSPDTNAGDQQLQALLNGESMEITFGLMNPSLVSGRLLFVVQCRDAANGQHQLQLLYSNWPEGSVQMTMVHGSLTPTVQSIAAPEEALQKGFGGWLTQHRRPLILLGAAITLAGYFLKDVANENIKEHLVEMNAGAREYRTNLPLIEQQAEDLRSLSAMVQGQAGSINPDKVLSALERVSNRQELNFHQVFALWKSLGDVPKSNSTDARNLANRTIALIDKRKEFATHHPADPIAFETGAAALLHEFAELNDQTGKVGADLWGLQFDESERLEHQASFYGGAITLLYLCGLALTVVSSLYGVKGAVASD